MDLHPDKYGYPIDSETTRGRNDTQGTWPESRYIKCKKCGYTMNTDRHPKGWGDGYVTASTFLVGPVVPGDTTVTVDNTSGFKTPATGTIASFSNYGLMGTLVTTTAAHTMTGGLVDITGTTLYDGQYPITEVPTSTTFVIGHTFVGDDSGTWIQYEYFYIYNITIVLRAVWGQVNWNDFFWGQNVTSETVEVLKVPYTGKTGTTFTGCLGITGNGYDNEVVSDRHIASGCPHCGTYEYD